MRIALRAEDKNRRSLKAWLECRLSAVECLLSAVGHLLSAVGHQKPSCLK